MRADLVAKYRTVPLQGRTIALVPYSPQHAAEVVRLRNDPRVRHYLHQPEELMLEQQLRWTDAYLARADDLYWMVERKGRLIGTNRLYDIGPAQGEKGSQIIEESESGAGPYALESDLLVLRFAFETLRLDRVLAVIRSDSGKVLSMNRRFGFRDAGARTVRSVEFRELVLESERFDATRFDALISYWSNRGEQ